MGSLKYSVWEGPLHQVLGAMWMMALNRCGSESKPASVQG